jgi:hypothetical protein
LRLPLSPAPRQLEEECVEPVTATPRLGCRDRHFELELVVAELLDGVAAVDQRPSGAFVVLAQHVALLLTIERPEFSTVRPVRPEFSTDRPLLPSASGSLAKIRLSRRRTLLAR